ncbi:quinone-interacting membrane-bound oxidoreductase complex subunit QmoC [candidate division KSB1 bacterium]
MAERMLVEPDVDFINTVMRQGGEDLKKCYQCATCSVVCELSSTDGVFPRKEMILAQWGMKDKLIGDPNVWLCHQCNDCSKHCPRGARPGDVLAGIRSYVYENFGFPSFMGKLLGSPKALPGLLIGILVMFFGLLYAIHGASFGFDIQNLRDVGYAEFLPHIWAEGLFVTGNVIIFLFAAVGFLRFWGKMKESNGGNAPGMIGSIISVLPDVIFHKRFSQCGENKPRYIAHMLVLFGFIGAAATAGLAVFFTVFVPIVESPIAVLNPIKLLGISSGIALIVGAWIMLSRRNSQTDSVGADGYSDKVFLYMIFLVSVTGMATYLIRLTDISVLGHAVYLVHLVFVFYLLWFMPYSKFAHMIYRMLGMAFAKGTAGSNGKAN